MKQFIFQHVYLYIQVIEAMYVCMYIEEETFTWEFRLRKMSSQSITHLENCLNENSKFRKARYVPFLYLVY